MEGCAFGARTQELRKRPWDELTDREKHERTMYFSFSRVPFTVDLGAKLLDWSEPGTVKVRLPYSPRMDNSGGTYHGGVIASLIDIAGAAAAWNGHDYSKGRRGLTISMNVNFLDRGGNETLIAVGRCIRRGAQLSFIEIRVETEDGRQVATGSLVYRIQ